MSYYDVYQSRINHLGESTAERIRNGGIRSFYKWMAESPHTVKQLSVERGLYFDGIILTNKDKEYEKIMFLNVANDIPLKVGDIMNWTLDDGSIEKWIIVQEEKKVNPTYRTFWIIRCNYLLKWIDNEGHIQQSWAYVVSSVDSKIKGNYRTWNALITPQPNKYAEILMPYYPIDRATNFIVQGESWHTIECDFTSVPGTIYISLTENKVNLVYDDLKNEIADMDKRAKYSLQMAAEPQSFVVSAEPLDLHFTVSKNGQVYTEIDENGEPIEPQLEYSVAAGSEEYIKVKNNQVYALKNGEATLLVRVAKDIAMEPLQFNIVIGEPVTITYYIKGPDKVRLDGEADYTLVNSEANEIAASWSLNTNLAKFKNKQYIGELVSTITLKMNDQNLLDKFILYASVGNIEVQKEIQVIPIW